MIFEGGGASAIGSFIDIFSYVYVHILVNIFLGVCKSENFEILLTTFLKKVGPKLLVNLCGGRAIRWGWFWPNLFSKGCFGPTFFQKVVKRLIAIIIK
jgi:hypothetical protein